MCTVSCNYIQNKLARPAVFVVKGGKKLTVVAFLHETSTVFPNSLFIREIEQYGIPVITTDMDFFDVSDCGDIFAIGLGGNTFVKNIVESGGIGVRVDRLDFKDIASLGLSVINKIRAGYIASLSFPLEKIGIIR